MKLSGKNTKSNLRKFVFASDGRIAPNTEDSDNFQVLGYAEGKDVESAKQILMEENEWILKNGFSPEEIHAYEIIEHKKLVITKKNEFS